MLVSKNRIKLFLITAFLAVVTAVLLLPSVSLAQDLDTGLNYAANIGLANPGDKDVRVFIAEVVRYFLGFLGIIAVAIIMYGGFLWMTSNGDPQKVDKAKKTLLNAVIGLIIIMSAFAIVSWIINFMDGGGNGGPGKGRGNQGNGRGLTAIGNCAVESVYPEPFQQDVPRNTSIIVTFIEPVDIGSLADGEEIKTEAVQIFKAGEQDDNKLPAIVSESDDHRTFVFTPKEYLGSPTENTEYHVFLSEAITKLDGKPVFEKCIEKFLEWQFEVSTKLDLAPPQVLNGGVFPSPDNWKDAKATVNAAAASGKLTVVAQPVSRTLATFGNPIGAKSAALSNKNEYSTVSGNLTLAIFSENTKLYAKLTNGAIALGSVPAETKELVFPGYFTFTNNGDDYATGDSWAISATAYAAGDTLRLGKITYSFGAAGIAVGVNAVATAQNIANMINLGNASLDIPINPDAAAIVSGNAITVNAKIAGAEGNNIALAPSDPAKIEVEKMTGGQAAGTVTTVIGRIDQARNAAIQIIFNEAVNPLSVSGSANAVKERIMVQCVDCASGDPYTMDCEADNDMSDTEVCLDGSFSQSNLYRTVEFISNNICGVNGCGEKIYCLPADKRLFVRINAASLANCPGDIDCATRPPFTGCSSSICKNSENKNYPYANPGLLNGIVDMAFNSFDGDRDTWAEGPKEQSSTDAYNENRLIGRCNGGTNDGKLCAVENKDAICGTSINCVNAEDVADVQGDSGDDYAWSFFIGSTIKIGSPFIKNLDPNPFDSDADSQLPLAASFNGLMLMSSLRTGEHISSNETDKVLHKRVNLRAMDGRATGYWTAARNLDAAPADGEPESTVLEIRHPVLPDFVSYRAQIGSGVKDIYQNCFKPSSGPSSLGNCAATDSKPNCCPNSGAIDPVDSAGLDGKGNCK